MAAGEFAHAHPALAGFWHPVAWSDEVGNEPVAAGLLGQGWVLARFGDDLSAFADACPHRRARLSAGVLTDGTLQCPYHGWRFGNDGRCVQIPALEASAPIPPRAALRPAAGIAERDGLVWLAPSAPRAGPPDLSVPAGLSGDRVATARLPVVHVAANAAVMVDNFLDEAHLPFVHAATIGGAGPEPIPRAEVVRDGLGFTAVREHTFTNRTDPAVLDGTRPAVQRRRMTYRYQAPLTATLLLEYLDAGSWQFLTFTAAPDHEPAAPAAPADPAGPARASGSSCRVYRTITGPGLADPELAESTVKYEMTVFEEDLDLQRRALSGLEFPLDISAELHTRADRVSVEFRRVLAEAIGSPRPAKTD
ncbi:MAG TPA: Rieske 2Fe-2S domain-containing protein [Streptosporangiaceae bacterium]